MKSFYILALLVVGLTAACKVELSIKSSAIVTSEYTTNTVITVSSNDVISTGIKIKPEDIGQTNTGYILDLDGDSINDHVILNGNTVSFSKGVGNNEFGPKKILMLIGIDNIRAYSFAYKEGHKLPMFQFWDTNLNGYYMPNLGTNNESDGLPRFGAVESQ